MSAIRIPSFIAIITGVAMVAWGRWLQRPLDQPAPAGFNLGDLNFATQLTTWGIVIGVLGCWGFVRSTRALESPKAVRFAGAASIVLGGILLLSGIAWASLSAVALTGRDPALITITGIMGIPALFGLLIGLMLLFSGIRAVRRPVVDARPRRGPSGIDPGAADPESW
jgi:hypothetical protein